MLLTRFLADLGPDALGTYAYTATDADCSICFVDEGTTVVLPCRHRFHSMCLMKSIQHTVGSSNGAATLCLEECRCPYCRQPLFALPGHTLPPELEALRACFVTA